MGPVFHSWIAGALVKACATAGALFGWLGIGVLAWGGVRALARLLRGSLAGSDSYAKARLDLGRNLALSLEFLVAKDVLDSIVEPTWDELGKLAATIALRTVIQLSLTRELREVEAHDLGRPLAEAKARPT
jgi:uncharacterized membrane protein